MLDPPYFLPLALQASLEYMVCRPENDFFPDLSKVGGQGGRGGEACWCAGGMCGGWRADVPAVPEVLSERSVLFWPVFGELGTPWASLHMCSLACCLQVQSRCLIGEL